MNQTQLEFSVRLLTLFAAASTLLLLVLVILLYRSRRTKKFVELDVQQINVREPDGRLAMVIGNSERLDRERPDRRGVAGMLFYSGGAEVGGLTYATKVEDGQVDSFGHLSFDRYQNDQVVVLNYHEDERGRAAGLRIVDRDPKITLEEIRARRAKAKSGEPEEREAANRWLAENTGYGKNWANRIVVASYRGEAMILLNDQKARPRIRLAVDTAGTPNLEFLDEEGAVVHRLPAEE